MKKYFIVAKNTWDEILTYRVNFTLWRIRTVVAVLISYFLWSSVIPSDGSLFGYTREAMISYILIGPILYSIIFATRSHEISENINSGDLSLWLVKPFGYFKYWFARDMGDKAMNLAFCVVEFSLLFLTLRPELYIQTNPYYLGLVLVAVVMAVLLQFYISCLISMMGFWSPEAWAPRFIFYVLLSFFTGSVFPLDILPEPIYQVLMVLPFAYLQYFPLKIYLGQMGFMEIAQGFGVLIFWTAFFYFVLMKVWKLGLKNYAASGR